MAQGSSVDVVVVGGAVVGSAVAYFLASHPRFSGRVVVLEADPTYARCATTRSAASIRHQFSTPANVQLSMAGTAFLREAGERLAVDGQSPQLGFREAGYLFLTEGEGAAAMRDAHGVQRAEGAQVALLDPAALQQRFPWLAVHDLALGSLGLAGEGWLDAHALMHALRRKALSLGVTYRPVHAATFEREGDRITAVRLADGSRITCGWAVNAAGTGATALAASAGIDLPVRARRRCVFHFDSPAQLPGCGLVIDTTGVWFRPEGSGFITGVSPDAAHDPDVDDLDDFDVDHTVFDAVLWPALASRVPAFEALRLRSAWAGHYDLNLLDANAILGPHPEVHNLLFANGFSGHGLQQAPGVGRALAEWIVDGGWRTLDLSALGWQRLLDGSGRREQAVV